MLAVATMWDDGLISDLRLIEILHKCGATAAFALSPSRHQVSRSINDNRGDYGILVSKSELKEFADFEVCNHTDTHRDLGKLGEKETRQEIINGRKKLEDIFQRPIEGFCYPYGVHTPAAIKALSDSLVTYARTTAFATNGNNLLLHPTCRWNELDVESYAEIDGKIILWGHSYELRSLKDWERITNMYEFLASHAKVKLVSFQEIVGAEYEALSRVGLHRSSKKSCLV